MDKHDYKALFPADIVQYLEESEESIAKVLSARNQGLATHYKTVVNVNATKQDRLWDMKLKGEFIDSIIVTSDGQEEGFHLDMLLELNPHLLNSLHLVCNRSEYIREYRLESQIPLDGLVLRSILYYAYHGHVEIDESNATRLAHFAQQFRLQAMMRSLLQYFRLHLTTSNAIIAYEMSTKLPENSSEPITQVNLYRNFICDHFDEVLKQNKPALMGLQFQLLSDLLVEDKLNVANEEVVWHVISEWVRINLMERKQYLVPLLQKCLRFGRIKDEFVKSHILNCALMNAAITPEEQSRMVQAIELEVKNAGLVLRDGHGLLYSLASHNCRPRETKYVLMAAGGWVEGRTSATVEIYDYQLNLWTPSRIKLPERISYFGMEIVGSVLYVFGGSNGREIYSQMHALDLNGSEEWVRKCTMLERRCYVSSVVYRGEIYALGGFNSGSRTRKCERYHPDTNSWEEIAEMNYARSDASAVVLRDKIYIAGGINDVNVEKTVEVYDVTLGVWSLVKSMNTPRTSFSIASFEGAIWALGGNDGSRRTNTVECWNPDTDEWQEMAPMAQRRSTFRAMVMMGELYAVGGYNSQSPICNVEKYVPSKGWVEVKELRHDRSGLGLISVANTFELLKM